jgi:hypothetical protein
LRRTSSELNNYHMEYIDRRIEELDWERSRGDPDCPKCLGEGVVYVPNGDDDYDPTVCECVKRDRGEPEED